MKRRLRWWEWFIVLYFLLLPFFVVAIAFLITSLEINIVRPPLRFQTLLLVLFIGCTVFTLPLLWLFEDRIVSNLQSKSRITKDSPRRMVFLLGLLFSAMPALYGLLLFLAGIHIVGLYLFAGVSYVATAAWALHGVRSSRRPIKRMEETRLRCDEGDKERWRAQGLKFFEGDGCLYIGFTLIGLAVLSLVFLGFAVSVIVEGLTLALFGLSSFWEPAHGIIIRVTRTASASSEFIRPPFPWWKTLFRMLGILQYPLLLFALGLWLLLKLGFCGQNILCLMLRR